MKWLHVTETEVPMNCLKEAKNVITYMFLKLSLLHNAVRNKKNHKYSLNLFHDKLQQLSGLLLLLTSNILYYT